MRAEGRRRVVAVVAGAVCASVMAASGAAEPIFDAQAALERLERQDRRVAQTAWRLASEAGDLCAERRAAVGLTLHAAEQYGPRLRQAAVARYGFDDATVAVAATPPDAPAASAGVRPGDQITAVGDAAVPREASAAGRAHADRLVAVAALIDEAAAAGPVRLRLRRGAEDLEIEVEPRVVCAYEVHLVPDERLFAKADRRRVFISSALADYAADDAELALILGHELAHVFLGHAERLARRNPARAVAGTFGTAPWEVARTEREADETGLRLALRAGYDMSGAGAFWRRMARDHPRTAGLMWGHAPAHVRARRLEAALSAFRADER